MRLSVLLLAVCLVPDDPGASYYKFAKGSVWTYSLTTTDAKDEKETVTMTITGEAEGRVDVDMVSKGRVGKSSKMTWMVSDGLFSWAERRGENLVDQIALYKVGSKKGDGWTLEKTNRTPKQTSSHLGTEEIKVTAGVYKDAVHTRIEMVDGDIQLKIDVYLVEKVGVVKMAYSSAAGGMTFELQDFKPAK